MTTNPGFLNFTFGIKFTNFRIKGSKVRPSLYSTKKNAVKTTKVPASGCNRIRIMGMIIIISAIKTLLEFNCLRFISPTYFANNRAVVIFANSAGCIPMLPIPIHARAPFIGGINNTKTRRPNITTYIGKANFLYTSESIKNTIIPRNRDKQIHIICFPYFSEKLKIFGCSSLKATEYMVISPKK